MGYSPRTLLPVIQAPTMGVGADGLSVIWVWNTASGASELGVTDWDLGRQVPGGFPETRGKYNKRSCKSSKAPQILRILHLHNKATVQGTCCLRVYLYLQLGSMPGQKLRSKVLAWQEPRTHAKTRGFVLGECGVMLQNITKTLGW